MATNTKHAFTHQSPAIDYLMSLNAELMFLSKSFHRKQNFSEFAIVVILCDYLNLIHIFQSCAFLEFNRPMSSSLLEQSNVLASVPYQRCTKCSVVSKTHRIKLDGVDLLPLAWMAGGTTLPAALDASASPDAQPIWNWKVVCNLCQR